ncbi:hypothetical protein [Pseudomonas putida]|uniref:hypothetical protein n=1 Tax=Pseudomonas putida TaxID=303 RepID=UPI0011AF44FF|nr:hypothetical protein [Pseudomonas putida]
MDFKSISATPVASIPTADLTWAGTGADALLAHLPSGLAAHVVSYVMIAVAFVVCANRNSFELTTQGSATVQKTMWMAVLFAIAMYSTVHSTSTVFLYFNF